MRGLSKDGNKEELAALCYAAIQIKLPVMPSQSDYLLQNSRDYSRLLHIDNVIIQDPLKICENWQQEKVGITR